MNTTTLETTRRQTPAATSQTSMRLTVKCLELIDQMAAELGLNKTGIVEIAIREKAIRDGYMTPRSSEG